MVTAIGGNHHRIDYLIGPGRALDPSKYFIIATDAIGNGLTTSPSNSKAQPRMQFPTDPNWNGGSYSAANPPEQGMRLWSGWLSGVIVRTPGYQEALYPTNMDAIAYLKGVRDAGWRRMDAVDWIYQSWAYDAHNVGTTLGFNGDYHRALRSIKAKTLILAGSGDLLNPEYEAMEMTHYISDVRYVAINSTRPMGHLSGAGVTAPENELQNREIGTFLELVANRGRKIQ